MRLVSQDGMVDVPYEISALSIGRIGESSTIYIRSKLLDEKPYVFATYSTEAKALRVMEMLRGEYLQYCTARSNEYWFAFNNPKAFQFPKDEEVEV